MSWQAWFTLGTILVMIVALVREWTRMDVTLLAALGVLLIGGVVPPAEAFSGFSDPAIITIASLYVVAAGIHRTGMLAWMDRSLTRRNHSATSLLFRITVPTALVSAFLNNTPVVVMLIPRIQAVARKMGLSASRLLMPLSFAAIAGGMITLIGTSTNLIASGLVQDAGFEGFGLFEFAWIGIPAAAFVVLYLATFGHRLMPDSGPDEWDEAHALDYRFDLRVPDQSPLAGMSVQAANLRSLGDAYLVYIRRGGIRIGPVAPEAILLGSDVLTFIGKAEAMERLMRDAGLAKATDDMHANPDDPETPLFQAVISANSTLAGKTLKQVGFRERYQGIVLAIHRRNASIRGVLGNIHLEPGDLLVVEATKGFEKQWTQSQGDFYLVTPKDRDEAAPGRRPPLALMAVATFIGLHVLGLLALHVAAFAAALSMIFLGCLRGMPLRRSVDFTVMLTMAAAFGIGHAVQASGLAAVVGHGIASILPGQEPLGTLLLLYVATTLVTEIITNSAAVVIMIPIAMATAVDIGADPHAMALTVTIAASASFLSPLGYQTNLMVMGAGGYRFRDYLRAGLPASLGVMTITLLVASLKWL